MGELYSSVNRIKMGNEMPKGCWAVGPKHKNIINEPEPPQRL